MKIEGISARLGSKSISNDDILKIIEENSRDFEGDLSKTLGIIQKLLQKSGSKTRKWLDEGERPIDLLKEAVSDALSQAGLKTSEIDLLIYVGVGRGFLEPGGAYLVAQALQMWSVECFDIIDACMSWTRALQMSNALLKTKQYKNILIVNCECNMPENGPANKNFSLKHSRQLTHIFPTYTIGEACSATVLSDRIDDNFSVCFQSKPEYADLCTITTATYEGFCEPSDKIALNGVGNFTSFGKELHTYLAEGAHQVMNQLSFNREDISKIFTHASTSTKWHQYAQREGLEDKVFHIYPDTGNLVSASLPTAIHLALKDDAIKSGQTFLGWVGSAGMSFAAFKMAL